MAGRYQIDPLYDVLKAPKHQYRPEEIARLFSKVSKRRVEHLAGVLSHYIVENLPAAIEKRGGLADYRTNPYVLMASANIMELDSTSRFADFLFNNKLYMGLESSFGKSIETAIVGAYPIGVTAGHRWIEPPEKVAEAASLKGMGREQKARKRRESVWREIDTSCVLHNKRFLLSIKSGPNCINDTQVQAMTDAIASNHQRWFDETRRTYPRVRTIDIIVGLTYGTDRTTNNKENQILAKLVDAGFIEEDRTRKPGVLVHQKSKATRVYRRIGQDFWALVGRPSSPVAAQFMFLEVLLSLARALSRGIQQADLEVRINEKIRALSKALTQLTFPRRGLPPWIGQDLSDAELFWFATAITAFYDEGI